MRPWQFFSSLVLMLLAPAWAAEAQSSFIDLSTPMTGKASYVFHADGTPVERGVPLIKFEREENTRGAAPNVRASAVVNGPSGSGGPVGCGGPAYGALSCVNGRPKVYYVGSYQRRDGTVVRSHFRSLGRRR